jgi:Notch-like protein
MFDPVSGKLSIGDTWSDIDPYDPQPPISKKRRGDPYSSGQTVMTDFDDTESDPRCNGEDSRQWTQKHLSAADPAFLHNPEILGAITPPSHHDQGDMLGSSSASLLNGNDVDVRGPMGATPLMIASFRGNGCGLDSGELEEDVDDSSAAVIQDLITQGANLNQQMEKTKETPLHLAARHARADAAKTLLDSGADANAQDITGRTPLHAAVASDAQGVFHILIKNRSTNLNARTEDGTTPLILAARLAIEGMVEQLIEAQADINMADGDQEAKIPDKTPLHWAASVNNVDAVNVLLQHGANRDAQDKKDETPLFLAAREGSYQAAKALLDHCANRDIQDHMDRLPIHIAQERMHQDIVTLLEQHIPPAPQHMAASSANLHPHHQQQHSVLSQQLHLSPPGTHSMSLLTASGNQHMMAPNATGTKPRAKKQRTKSLAQSPEDNNIQNVNMNGGATLPRNGQTPQQRKQQQQQSLKRKKLPPTPDQQAASNAAQMEMMLSPPEYQTNGQNNPLALSHPNLEDLMSGEGHALNGGMVSKPPPRYEEAAAMARSMQALQGGMPGQQCLESQYSNFSANLRQSQAAAPGTHPRQQSMPTPMSTTINNPTISNNGSNSSYSSHLSPPHSNMSSHMSPTQTLSPSHIGSAMSPPQSVQSNHTMSPPHHQQMHMSPPPHGNGGQQQLSPMKSQQMNGRQQQMGSQMLPTSPTHIAAMRGATHQRHQQFDFNNVSSQQQFMYPTPPHSQGGQGGLLQNGVTSNAGMSDGMNYMTPSPDSPGQWSSASPQSHSDWSETGIHSPPSNNNCVGGQAHQNSFHLNQQKQQQQQQMQHQQQQQQMAQQQMLQQQTDGVLI